MSYYTESFHNCVHLLNKYRWMAGDTTSPQVALKAQKDRKSGIQKPMTDPERKLIINLYNDGKTYKEIMASTGRSHPVIIRTLRKVGIDPRCNRRLITAEEDRKMMELYRQGVRPLHIATQLGIGSATVHKRIVRILKLPKSQQP